MTTPPKSHEVHIESLYMAEHDASRVRMSIGPSGIATGPQEARSIALAILEAAATAELDTAIIKFLRTSTNLTMDQILNLLDQMHLAQDEAKKEVPKTQ